MAKEKVIGFKTSIRGRGIKKDIKYKEDNYIKSIKLLREMIEKHGHIRLGFSNLHVRVKKFLHQIDQSGDNKH